MSLVDFTVNDLLTVKSTAQPPPCVEPSIRFSRARLRRAGPSGADPGPRHGRVDHQRECADGRGSRVLGGWGRGGVSPLVGGSLARCLLRGSAPARATTAVPPYPPYVGARRCAPGDRACKSGPGRPPRAGHRVAAKARRQGAPIGASLLRSGQTLDGELPRQDLASIRRTGGEPRPYKKTTIMAAGTARPREPRISGSGCRWIPCPSSVLTATSGWCAVRAV
jgi:hypothetical protein